MAAYLNYRDNFIEVDKLKTQKGIVIDQKIIPGANHFFENHMDELMSECGNYLDRRLGIGTEVA